MPEYSYHYESFEKDTETVDVPPEAVGITVDYFGDLATVEYLLPMEDGDE